MGWQTILTHQRGRRAIPDICPLCERPVLVEAPRQLTSTADILRCLEHFRDKPQEYLVSLSLDAGQHLIARRIVTIGLLNSSLAHPREVFAGPLMDRAASVILAHNHPSGVAEPSSDDISATKQLAAAGELLGIQLQDHLILTSDQYYSFQADHLI